MTGFLHWCVNLDDAAQPRSTGWIDRIYPKNQLYWDMSGLMKLIFWINGRPAPLEERSPINLGVGRTILSWSDYWFLKDGAQTGLMVLVWLEQYRVSYNLRLLLPSKINNSACVVAFLNRQEQKLLILRCSEPHSEPQTCVNRGPKPAYLILRGSKRYKDDVPTPQSPCTAPICCHRRMWLQQSHIWWLKPALTGVWGR